MIAWAVLDHFLFEMFFQWKDIFFVIYDPYPGTYCITFFFKMFFLWKEMFFVNYVSYPRTWLLLSFKAKVPKVSNPLSVTFSERSHT